MKILYHHRTASRDGQSTHILEMIGALRALGHEVVEVAPAIGEAESDGGGSPGWVGSLKALLPRGLYELAELCYSLLAYRRLCTAVREHQPHAIYERYNLFLLAGIWTKQRFGLPLILEVNAPMALERARYGGLSWPRLARWSERWVWRRADAVLPVTSVLAHHLLAEGVAPERIQVIPNGINDAHYRNLPDTESAKAALGLTGRLVVGFTGFVREWDRLDRIVEWMAEALSQHSLHLLVVGDGPARAEIESVAQRLGISDRVSFTGVIPRERVPAHAMAFDIALQTALVPYASPLCLFEYLRLGKAIVAPDQPNHRELLLADVNAVLYPPDEPGGIEKALDRLCNEPLLREKVALGAAILIDERNLRWQDHAGTVIGRFRALGVA